VVSRLVGKHCESGDVVVRDLWMPEDVGGGARRAGTIGAAP
jgi:diaminopimelate decarboxylase